MCEKTLDLEPSKGPSKLTESSWTLSSCRDPATQIHRFQLRPENTFVRVELAHKLVASGSHCLSLADPQLRETREGWVMGRGEGGGGSRELIAPPSSTIRIYTFLQFTLFPLHTQHTSYSASGQATVASLLPAMCPFPRGQRQAALEEQAAWGAGRPGSRPEVPTCAGS